MLSPSMVKGPVLVKARKIAVENDNDYYLEFFLDENQIGGLVAELTVAHVKNNTLTIVHETQDKNASRIATIREIMKEYSDMNDEMKSFFLKKLGELV